MANLITDIGKGADETPDGFVRIQYQIPNLKTKLKKAVESEKFGEWGFSCIVRIPPKGDVGEKAYKPFIEKLPHEIDPEASYFKVEDNFLFVWLKKKDIDKSWKWDIMDDTLEKAND